MAAAGDGELRFFLSCDINVPITFCIDSLHGDLQSPARTEEAELSEQASPPELYVECGLYIDGFLFGLPTRTRLAVEKPYRWTEAVTLSAKYRDLTGNAQLAFTVWDVSCPGVEYAVGGACLRLFNSKKQLKTGKQKLRLWRGRVADGAVISSTPGKVPKSERGEVERLEKLRNKYDRGEIDHIDWLDKLALNSIDKIMSEERERGGDDHLHLIVELRTFVHMVVFQEMGAHLLLQAPITSENELVVVWDPEVGRQNPCENKQFKLSRGMRGMLDPDLKPSTSEKRSIFQILKYPPTRNLISEEKRLLWNYRFYLRTERNALTKVLRCVDWSDTEDAKQAIELMSKWESIDIPDALELLSPAFESEEVRAYAVQVLKDRTTDEELQCYLLQLVQALRFERHDKSKLALFLVERAVMNSELANFFRWYVTMELPDHSYTRRYYTIYEMFQEQMMKEKPWEWEQLFHQTELVAKLSTLARDVKNVRGTTQKKVEKLRQMLSGSGIMSELSSFKGLPLPLNPKIIVDGIVPYDSSVFKSAQNPLCLSFKTENREKCKVIFKKGDDLRQDQLVIQLITLMDKLLKAENLDLQLTPFRVLATAQDEGIFEYVPSKALAQVLADHKTLINYFRQHTPDPDGPFGISAPCLETFVKSCAGYCVITYILGVGDRHLDNLLLREDGRLFHVDFGFILGHDPKPFPPPMKLCKEMVEAMGGTDSAYYVKFKSYCCEAYNILRKSSNLILNLFYLMAGANIRDIASDPEKGILKLQEKFHLDLDDGEAVQFFQTLINDSVSALFPQMVETIHRWAQYWR